MMERDLTKHYDYDALVREEKEHYAEIEITDDLREGGAHASDCWTYYWQHVQRTLDTSPFADFAGALNARFGALGRPLRILSLGSGYCGHELKLARALTCDYRITCTDINPALFGPAQEIVDREQFAVTFAVEDINFITIEKGQYDLIFAHAAIHHVINLERLFEQLLLGLSPNGIFHLVDVVGQNRKLLWDANERMANALLRAIPKEITRGLRLNAPVEDEGMEGIRQEDTMPVLRATFEPIFEHRHGAFMRFICTNARLAKRLDPRDATARRYLDFLIDCDDSLVARGILEPLEVWGVYRPRKDGIAALDALIASDVLGSHKRGATERNLVVAVWHELDRRARRALRGMRRRVLGR
ncbi:class I SAM-dependent methyltransferase [Thiocapsa bogorovii]|uniref:class I SAM-dependent methyltransferase n=1 Tax=Thiocapsa bogorovii TaxID=521689 RepID=UPI001E4C2CBB|nr:class I SAM-dependent methyltransferase [Thiocapsa bogorovii]UHD17934.1 class I SAM-dependent methyltransferase [Thiocapsa bogorovii]